MWGYEGVERSPAEAFKLYQQAAELGFSDAAIRVGQLYESGNGAIHHLLRRWRLSRSCIKTETGPKDWRLRTMQVLFIVTLSHQTSSSAEDTDVKITDFGIATPTEEVFEEEITERGDITKTTSGRVKGALPYMAPEMMFRKKGDYVGREADIWSLGAVMFHVLTGTLPFDEGLIVPANVKTGTRAPWPSFMTNDQQFASLARSLLELVEACLQFETAKRPTADDLMRACNELMYCSGTWTIGTVQNMPASTYGYIRGSDGRTAFFHRDSTYGPRSPW